MRLKQFDKAEKCIAQALEAENQAPASEALQSLMSQAKFFGLLAQVHERSGKQRFFYLSQEENDLSKFFYYGTFFTTWL